MDIRPDPRIIYLDRLGDGAVVTFDNGRSAYYSAALLYATLPQARAMPSGDEDAGHDGGHGKALTEARAGECPA
jgi:hypothetical protein